MYGMHCIKDISPNGEDTRALCLTSELVDLRAGYAKWIRRTKVREPRRVWLHI